MSNVGTGSTKPNGEGGGGKNGSPAGVAYQRLLLGPKPRNVGRSGGGLWCGVLKDVIHGGPETGFKARGEKTDKKGARMTAGGFEQ